MGALFGDETLPRPAREVAPGCQWVPGWLDAGQQTWVVRQWSTWAAGPVPAHRPAVRGGRMSVAMVPFGWVWTSGGYAREAPGIESPDEGTRPPSAPLPVPDWMVRVYRRAVAATGFDAWADATPDAALVNHYLPDTSMGMHRDADELTEAPVVSLSVGEACTFRFGNTETRTRPWTDIRLESGDLVVFGGPARRAFHGVPRIHPGTAPDAVAAAQVEAGLPGRLNLTLRVTGLER
ncbi:alpha-ketoglutarate-dependent dioxygenase AlkB [Kytococcus sedentarius]|uniref:alpha-ketoglutarate-dependent dioxygenase AlkB family protein n=1 Tax=Kytococcus sedentarius TaxID=1276 RepID=UPI0035BC71A9